MTTKINTMPEIGWAEGGAALDAAQSILVATHVSPDGDAIGSQMGLVNALRQRYPQKRIDAAVDGGVPPFLQFLPNSEIVQASLNEGEWDVMVSVDASDEERTGHAGVYGRAHSQIVINLDHHATNTRFGQIHLVMSQAVSATEIVFDWLNHLQQPLTREIALPLLTGLVTDTLGFRTSNVSARTLEIAQHLMSAGASLTEVTARTLDTMPYTSLNLWRHVFTTIDLSDGVISATVAQADLTRVGAVETTDSGLSGFLVKVNEAMIAAVFKETPEGRVELSFRSKPGFDVSSAALALGGGGHKQASGATIDGPLEAARARVLPLLKEAVSSGKLVIA